MANIVKSNKDNRTKLGELITLNITTPVFFDKRAEKGLIGIYLKADALNDEAVLMTSDTSYPSQYNYWPDNLKILPNESKFVSYTGGIIKFLAVNGFNPQLLRIVPLYQV